MLRLILWRVLAVVPILIGVSIVTFLLMRLVPGDITLTLLGPFATESTQKALREYYGLDQPLYVQYFKWLWSVVQGNFGRSITYQIPVAEILSKRIWNTVILTVAAAVIAIGVGFVGGMLAGVRRFSAIDRASTLATLVAASAPTFWICLLLLYAFALKLRWFPATGMYTIGKEGDPPQPALAPAAAGLFGLPGFACRDLPPHALRVPGGHEPGLHTGGKGPRTVPGTHRARLRRA